MSASEPPLPSDEDLMAVLESTAKPAVVFKPLFPSEDDADATTFFGGAPRLPAGSEWPVRQGDPTQTNTVDNGVPHTFLGQVDCSELPQFEGREALPESGILAFFLDWALTERSSRLSIKNRNLVIHYPDDGKKLKELREPDQLPTCYGNFGWNYFYPWLSGTSTSTRVLPKAFPKVAHEPFTWHSFSREHPGDPREVDWQILDRYRELAAEERTRRLEKAIPASEPGESFQDPLLSKNVWRPDPGFPDGWISVEVFAGNLAGVLTQQLRFPESISPRGTKADLSSTERQDAYEGYGAVCRQALEWVERSRKEGLYSPLSEDARSEFWAWCEDIDASSLHKIFDPRGAFSLAKHLKDAVFRGSRYLLTHSATTAALVPDRIKSVIRHKYFRFGRPYTAQLLGVDRVVKPVPQGSTELIQLMQFEWCDLLDWQWGDCDRLTYWLSPAELAQHNFDNIRVTIESN